jgi:4-amino-4-deoxy-L-arabinose transferase-like glycosyltransferase
VIAESVTILSLCVAGSALSGSTSAGIGAASLYTIYPLAVQQSMMYYPSSFQVASIALAIALIALASRNVPSRQPMLGFLAGISLGLGYLVKEDVAIVVAAIALAAIVVRFPAARIGGGRLCRRGPRICRRVFPVLAIHW